VRHDLTCKCMLISLINAWFNICLVKLVVGGDTQEPASRSASMESSCSVLNALQSTLIALKLIFCSKRWRQTYVVDGHDSLT
jgi:hypothetical protein